MSLPSKPVLHPVQERPLRNRPDPEEPEDEAEVEAEAEAELDEDEIPRWLESERLESEGGLSLHEINQLPGGICSGCADAEAEAGLASHRAKPTLRLRGSLTPIRLPGGKRRRQKRGTTLERDVGGR